MSKTQRRWSPEEDAILRQEVEALLGDRTTVLDGDDDGDGDGDGDCDITQWNEIAKKIPGRSRKDCRKRFYNEVTGGLKKGAWSKDEDAELEKHVKNCGPSWATIAKIMGNRSADQCSKRWTHYLDPSLDHSTWSHEENVRLFLAVQTHNTAWKDIQQLHFPSRSANNVKNTYALIKRKPISLPPGITSCCPQSSQNNASALGESLPSFTPSDSDDPCRTTDVNFTDLEQFGASPFSSAGTDTLDYGVLPDDNYVNSLFSPKTSGSIFQSPEMLPSASGMTTTMSEQLFSQFNTSPGYADSTDNDMKFSPSLDKPGDWLSSQGNGRTGIAEEFATWNPSALHLPSGPAFDFSAAEKEAIQVIERGLGTMNADIEVSGTGAPLSCGQTRITVNNLEPHTLMIILGILIHAKSKIQLETS